MSVRVPGRDEPLCDKHADRSEAEAVRIVQEVQQEGGSEEEMTEHRSAADLRLTQKTVQQATVVRELARELNIHACIPNNAS